MLHNGFMKIPKAELQDILSQQEIERVWWMATESYPTVQALHVGTGNGKLVVVHDTENFRISAHVPKQFHLLTPACKSLLEEVGKKWFAQMHERGLPTQEMFLVVSSLTRPTEYQKELARQGFPTADDSSHERGVAFDIGATWFREHYPAALETLLEILDGYRSSGLLNYIDEHSNGVIHVAMSPGYLAAHHH